MKKAFILAVLAAAPLQAQNFTTQAEVQPILEMTRANWVGLGTATGRDLLYFSHVLSWRCGIDEIRYGLNTATPYTVLQMEPCYPETTQPNAIRDLPYRSYPQGTIRSIVVELRFEDGQVLLENFHRGEIRFD